MKLKANFTHKGYHNAAGKRVPSVTTIVKHAEGSYEGLLIWANRLGQEGKDHREARDEAATIGHIGHAMVEADIRGMEFDSEGIPADMLEPASNTLQAFRSWRQMTNFQLLQTEIALVSERYQYGGRLDCVAQVEHNGRKETCIVDWKTSNSVHASYIVQVAAYRHAWNETHREQPIEGCHLLKINKEHGSFLHHYWASPVMDMGFRAFVNCREIYDLVKELKKAI